MMKIAALTASSALMAKAAEVYAKSMGDQRCRSSSLSATPAYYHHMPHPGIYYFENVNAGYPLKDKQYLPSEFARKILDSALKFMKSRPLGEMQTLFDTYCKQDSDSKGCEFEVNGQRLLLSASALKTENHKEMIADFRSWVGNIVEMSESEILEKIQNAHRLLFKGVAIDVLMRIGEFRKEEAVVFRDNHEDQDRSLEGLLKLIRKRGGTGEDVAVFKNYYEKMQASAGQPEDLEMTEAEKKATSLIYFSPCSFKEVPKQMRLFAKDLKEKLRVMHHCGPIDPIAAGAFAHQKVTEIHPFGDGNGRMARALMNAILMEYGYPPIVFPSDAEYTEAVERDAKEPGFFANYLRTVAIPELAINKQYLKGFEE